MNLIAAVDENWAIGNKGRLLVRIPADQKFFRETTEGKVVVMGRRTLLGLPGGLPLKNRVNIVLTHGTPRIGMGSGGTRKETVTGAGTAAGSTYARTPGNGAGTTAGSTYARTPGNGTGAGAGSTYARTPGNGAGTAAGSTYARTPGNGTGAAAGSTYARTPGNGTGAAAEGTHAETVAGGTHAGTLYDGAGTAACSAGNGETPPCGTSGAIYVNSLDALFGELKKYPSEDIYVIGGGTVYAQLLKDCDTAYITRIHYAYDADTYFPNLDGDPGWTVAEKSEEQTYFDLEYHYYKYVREKNRA